MSLCLAEQLHQIQQRCEHLFELREPAGGGLPIDEAAARASLPHPEWIPESVWAYARQLNGFSVSWQAATDAKASGIIWLLTLEDIFRDWEPEIGGWAGPRMRAFKPVDMHNGYLLVGLFHDEAQDPGLYVYEPGEGEPYPLYLDLPGYIALLSYSLGYQYWQAVLLELLPDDGRNPAHQTGSVTPDFRRDLEALDPDFDYEALVALYHEVKLKSYRPSEL